MIGTMLLFFIGGAIFMIVLIALLNANRQDSVDAQIYENRILDRDNEIGTLNEVIDKQDKTIYNQKLKINELLKVNHELMDEAATKVARSN
ncbi:MAG: hypothetical protein JETCAE03_35390 [Ignavibacteriaceae bacterium]|nr:MAG: hypothetical protein JETCAE03_35390 [Ignavibacteriaceae bacterium]